MLLWPVCCMKGNFFCLNGACRLLRLNTKHPHATRVKTQHSTVTVLHTLNNTVAKGFNQMAPTPRTITVALDMSKALRKADVLGMSVVCVMRGVGGVCEMCMRLARGGVGGQGWVDERIGLGIFQSCGNRGSVGRVSVFGLRLCG